MSFLCWCQASRRIRKEEERNFIIPPGDRAYSRARVTMMRLYSLIVVGMNDLWKCSLQREWFSLWLKELLIAPTASCRGWRGVSTMDVSAANILLSPTVSTVTSQDRARPPHQFVNFLSVPVHLPSRPLRRKGQMLRRNSIWRSSRILHPPKDLSLLSRWRRLWPFLYRTPVCCSVDVLKISFSS